MLAEVTARFENFPQAFVIGDVVTNKIGRPHMRATHERSVRLHSKRLACCEWDVFRNFTR